MPLAELKKTKFKHQMVGKDWSEFAEQMGVDPDMWRVMEIGDFFRFPDEWPFTDRDILWLIDDPRFDHDFVLVKYGGKRFIERIDK